MQRTEVSVASLLGPSQAMRRVREFALTAARVNAPVLILGETGTGKSLLGRVIHAESPRAGGPYQAVNCAGVPDTLFESEFFGHQRGAFTGAREARRGVMEQAHGGTLLLDEVGELSLSQQAKLLIALEEGEIRRLGDEGTVRIDARILAASARSLPAEVRRGSFRRDLYHRLAVLCCCLPPLRARMEDIPVLAQRLLKVHRSRHGRPGSPLSVASVAFLQGRDWPGNVRELSHILEAALILSDGDRVDEGALEAAGAMGREESGQTTSLEPTAVSPSRPVRQEAYSRRYSFHGRPEEEKEVIRQALRQCRGNRSEVARILGMARNTLRARLREYGLE